MAQINGYGSCTTDYTGSGVIGCDKSDWGDLKGFGLLTKGTTWDITDNEVALTEALWKGKINSSNLFPYNGAYDYDSIGNDNDVNTSNLQVEKDVRAGLPKIQWMFTDGNCRQASLWNKKGYGNWDLVLFYANGMRMASNSLKTKAKGFDGGNFSVSSETIQKGTDLQTSTCSMQLLDADEFAERNVFLTWDDLGFDATDINGFNDVDLSTPSTTAGTAYSVGVTSKCNTSFNVLDLDDTGNWAITGVQASATTISAVVYNATTNKNDFTITPTTIATDTIGFKLNDGTNDVGVDSLGNAFKGASAISTIA